MAAPQPQQPQQPQVSSTMRSNMSAAFTPTRINARIVMMKLCLGSGIVLGLIGASLLVAFGVLYVRPYIQVKDMVRTECVISNSSVLSDLVKCECDDASIDCISSYPCLYLLVNYTKSNGAVKTDAQLYDSLDTYLLQESAQQCSYHTCDRSISDNIKTVKKFSERYEEQMTSFDCFYKPDSPDYVLIDILTTSDIVHAMLWPGLAFLTGAVILSVYIFDIGINHVTTPLGGSPFNSLEKPWLRHIERNYEKVGTLSEYNASNEEDNEAHVRLDSS